MTAMPASDVPPSSAARAEEALHETRSREVVGSLASAVRVVSGLTLVSRLSGLARDVITARLFGDAVLGSAFRAAYAVPNLFRRLFGEGALSAAFLPEYTLLRRDDPTLAAALGSLVIRLLTLVTGGLTLLLMLGLVVTLWLVPADPERSLSFRLMVLMLPMMPAVCLTAILGGMLQAQGKFGPPAAAPILLNIFQIIAGLAFYLGLTTDRTLTAYAVGGAAVLASAAQVAWSWIALRGTVRWHAVARDALPHARSVLSRFGPAVLGLGTLQLNTFLDMTVAMWPVWIGPTMLGRPVPLDDHSNSILSFTQTIYQFPLGVFGIAVATAVFPLLSRAADKPGEFLDVLRRGLRLSMFIGLPASAGLLLVRHDLIATIFSGGRSAFSAEGVDRAAAVLAGFAPGVWAYSLNHVWTRAFYAKGDTRTPMRLAMVTVVLNATLNLTLIWWLREAGLAWATGIAAVFQSIVLGALCNRLLGTAPADRATWLAWGRIGLLTGVMAGAVWLALRLMPAPSNWTWHAVRLATAVVVGGGTYLLGAIVLRCPELRWLMTRAPRGSGGAATTMSFE